MSRHRFIVIGGQEVFSAPLIPTRRALMDNTNLLTTRDQLQAEIAEFQPPRSPTLDISPYLAMSLLQKAIRRGRSQLALNAGATLLQQSPERLWRRLSCIAFED